MGIETAKTGKLLYHLTKISNLDSIIKFGMLPRKVVIDNKMQFGDIADANIISKRKKLGLDSYTPFHFHPYSAFDVAVKHVYQGHDMIYLCIDRETAKKNNFKILPKHPLSTNECNLYDYAKQVKMAECLTEKRISIDIFTCMYVASEKVKEKTIEILNNNDVNFSPPYINIQGKWFDI